MGVPLKSPVGVSFFNDVREKTALAEIAAHAQSIRDSGGEGRCGEYGIFKLTLTDGRVFRKVGMHGWGGLFRYHRFGDPEKASPIEEQRARLLARAHRRIEQSRDDQVHRNVIFYLAECYCGSEDLKVVPEQIVSLELE